MAWDLYEETLIQTKICVMEPQCKTDGIKRTCSSLHFHYNSQILAYFPWNSYLKKVYFCHLVFLVPIPN